MSGIVPIRSGVEPEFDAERELIDYCATKVREYATRHGVAPTRIVVCLMGKTGCDEQSYQTSCWDVLDTRTESEMCGHAIALLAKKVS